MYLIENTACIRIIEICLYAKTFAWKLAPMKKNVPGYYTITQMQVDRCDYQTQE